MINLEHRKYREALGRVIRNEREAQGLSLRKIGLMVGLDYKRVHEIEHGRANVTLNSLLRIADGLGLSLSKMILATEARLAEELSDESDVFAEEGSARDRSTNSSAKAPIPMKSQFRYNYSATRLSDGSGRSRRP